MYIVEMYILLSRKSGLKTDDFKVLPVDTLGIIY